MPYGLPVSGLMLAGPVVVTFGSLVLRLTSASALMTKYLSVSIGLPAPMIGSQYPDAASVALYLPAACELPVAVVGRRVDPCEQQHRRDDHPAQGRRHVAFHALSRIVVFERSSAGSRPRCAGRHSSSRPAA
jgi:hypothetical protein